MYIPSASNPAAVINLHTSKSLDVVKHLATVCWRGGGAHPPRAQHDMTLWNWSRSLTGEQPPVVDYLRRVRFRGDQGQVSGHDQSISCRHIEKVTSAVVDGEDAGPYSSFLKPECLQSWKRNKVRVTKSVLRNAMRNRSNHSPFYHKKHARGFLKGEPSTIHIILFFKVYLGVFVSEHSSFVFHLMWEMLNPLLWVMFFFMLSFSSFFSYF